MPYVILTDSSCDMTKDLRERFGIDDYLRGNLVYPDGRTEKADLDFNNISVENFYGTMSDKTKLFKTSIPSISDVETFFEKYLKNGQDILMVNLSSGISGTFLLCQNAAKTLMEKYSERKIICVDTLKYCMAEGKLVIEASELKKAGKSIEEVADYLNDTKFKMHQIGFMDDLFFLSRSGRLKGVAAFFGSLIGLKPMAEINREGMNQVVGKTKGLKKAYKVIIEYIRKTIIDPQNQIITISQSMRKTEAEELKQLIMNEFSPREVIITSVCQSCGSSIGPGLCAVYYNGVELSEGLEKEKLILNECVENLKK